MADLSDKINVTIPLKGSGSDKIDLNCPAIMIEYALDGQLPSFLQNFWRRKVTAEIFLDYNNLRQLPPRMFLVVKRWGRARIGERIPKLEKLIDWDGVQKPIPITFGTCPNCRYHDPTWVKGSSIICPGCGKIIPG